MCLRHGGMVVMVVEAAAGAFNLLGVVVGGSYQLSPKPFLHRNHLAVTQEGFTVTPSTIGVKEEKAKNPKLDFNPRRVAGSPEKSCLQPKPSFCLKGFCASPKLPCPRRSRTSLGVWGVGGQGLQGFH